MDVLGLYGFRDVRLFGGRILLFEDKHIKIDEAAVESARSKHAVSIVEVVARLDPQKVSALFLEEDVYEVTDSYSVEAQTVLRQCLAPAETCPLVDTSLGALRDAQALVRVCEFVTFCRSPGRVNCLLSVALHWMDARKFQGTHRWPQRTEMRTPIRVADIGDMINFIFDSGRMSTFSGHPHTEGVSFVLHKARRGWLGLLRHNASLATRLSRAVRAELQEPDREEQEMGIVAQVAVDEPELAEAARIRSRALAAQRTRAAHQGRDAGARVMDVYALVRLFRFYRPPLAVAIYAGAAHTDFIWKVLARMGAEAEHHVGDERCLTHVPGLSDVLMSAQAWEAKQKRMREFLADNAAQLRALVQTHRQTVQLHLPPFHLSDASPPADAKVAVTVEENDRKRHKRLYQVRQLMQVQGWREGATTSVPMHWNAPSNPETHADIIRSLIDKWRRV